MYLLTHTPVHYHRPLQVGFREKAQWSDELFKKYMEGCEENRKAGCGRHYLSKRDIERWGFMPPCGARFEVVEVDLKWIPNSVEVPNVPSSPLPVENHITDLEEELYTGRKPDMR
jgi:hypothetical protein